jgi:hypothetical protein
VFGVQSSASRTLSAATDSPGDSVGAADVDGGADVDGEADDGTDSEGDGADADGAADSEAGAEDAADVSRDVDPAVGVGAAVAPGVAAVPQPPNTSTATATSAIQRISLPPIEPIGLRRTRKRRSGTRRGTATSGGPASFAGMSQIRFGGSVGGPTLSARVRSPEAFFCCGGIVAKGPR